MSEIKVNKISPRAACGTVQLGDSGDTFTIPAGATINNQGTATNFGATGSASWVTTVKTSTFTAVAGEGYFVNTTAGEVTVNLPAGTPGAVVAIKDYANTFNTNKVTVAPNGSDKIAGDNAADGTLTVAGIAVTIVFIDSTKGWLVTDSGLQSELPTAEYVTATGGTVTTSGDFKIHTFTGPGALCVSSAGNSAGSNTVSYVVVAGGGGAGWNRSGGGGAGGFRESKAATDSYTASPLNATSGPTYNLPVSATSYPITVGAGGGTTNGDPGVQGSSSSFSTITSAGGGAGGDGNTDTYPFTGGGAGGSGGGGGSCSGPTTTRPGGAGNTPPVSPPQGNNGGNTGPCTGYQEGGGGGGGAGAVGANTTQTATGANGGNGVATQINPAAGSPATNFAGGGAGGGKPCGGPAASGGTGGGANGSYGTNPISPGVANTGGGGGGAGPTASPVRATSGGSGIVIIRYKFQ